MACFVWMEFFGGSVALCVLFATFSSAFLKEKMVEENLDWKSVSKWARSVGTECALRREVSLAEMSKSVT